VCYLFVDTILVANTKRAELLDAQGTIASLEEQLRASREAKEQLARREQELEQATRLLSGERELEHEQRQQLAQEVQRREHEVLHMRQLVSIFLGFSIVKIHQKELLIQLVGYGNLFMTSFEPNTGNKALKCRTSMY